MSVTAAQVKGAWGKDVHVVLAGLTNTYSSYVTTFEEYGVQRYEGASTIFGPHTLDAYIQVGQHAILCAPVLRLFTWSQSLEMVTSMVSGLPYA